MDIKYVWITQNRSHAYILTVIDTFTRFVLHRQVGFWMKSAQVKHAWEQIIINYLQPADMLNNGIHIEIRNDNGPQFGSKVIQQFFEQNHLNQIFYTSIHTPGKRSHRKFPQHSFQCIGYSWVLGFKTAYNQAHNLL